MEGIKRERERVRMLPGMVSSLMDKEGMEKRWITSREVK